MNFDISTQKGMAHAMLWQADFIDKLADGGTWIVPRSGSLYTFNKVKKVVHRSGLMPDPSIDRVLQMLGWEVIGDK